MSRKNLPLTEGQKTRVIRYYKNGSTISNLAKQFEVASDTIRDILVKAGVPIRDHKGYGTHRTTPRTRDPTDEEDPTS